MNTNMTKKILLGLTGLFVLAFVLRVIFIKDMAITFFYDQARDAFIVKELLNGDLKIQGPSANAPGLFHGVFYYYFLAIPYYLGNGNPQAASLWMAFFSSATIFVVYLLTYALTKNRNASFLASLFFAVSFEAGQYSTWLSNPSLAVWFVPLIYLFLWLWTTQGKKIYAGLTGLAFGLSIQADLFLAYHAVAIFIWLMVNRKNAVRDEILAFLMGLGAGASTLIFSEVKFGFKGIQGLLFILTGGDAAVRSRDIADFIILYINQLGHLFSQNLFPFNPGYGGALGLIMVFWLVYQWRKNAGGRSDSYQAFLLLFIISHLPVVALGGSGSPYLAVGIGSAACILTGIFIYEIWEKSRAFALFLVFAILISGVGKTIMENKGGQTVFAPRPSMVLYNLVNAVEYTYQASGGGNFSVNTITAPFWLNTTWSYIYNWYGLSKHGFLPYWHGRDQVGYWGDNLGKTPSDVSDYYLIIEPLSGIPETYVNQEIAAENAKSKLLEERNFGGVVVQKRAAITVNKK